MKRILASLVIVNLMLSPVSASPSLMGDEGFINTPSSEVIPDRNINIGLSYLPGARSYIYTGKTNLIYSMSLGFIPRTELSVTFNQVFGWVTPDNPYLTDSAFDRSINAKFQVLDEKEFIPSLAIGGRDILSNALLNKDRAILNNSLQQMFYLALGKNIKGYKVNIGYSYAPIVPLGFSNNFENVTKDTLAKGFRVSGFFIAAETPKFFSLISGIIEFDSKYFNYGLDVNYNGFQAKLTMVDLTNFNTRVSWGTRL